MPNNLKFRADIGPTDPESVRTMVLSTGFFNDEEVDVAAELATDRLEKGEKSDYRFIFADLDDRTIGYSCYGRIAGTVQSYDFYWLAVLNELRGKGIGKQLIAATEEAVRCAGGGRIYIETSSRDQYVPTRGLYLKCGYRIEAIIEDFYAPGDSKVLLVKVV